MSVKVREEVMWFAERIEEMLRELEKENRQLTKALEKIAGSTPGPGIDASRVAKAALEE